MTGNGDNAVGELAGLGTVGDLAEYLERALPLVAGLTAATRAAVVRRTSEGWAVDAAVGGPPPVDDLPAQLGGTMSLPGWGDCVETHALPGLGTVLLLADADEAASSAGGTALAVLETAVGRLVAEQRLGDLQSRVDNAQQLAGMGDYDWHIATDTNTWSDQLYRIYGHEPGAFNASYERFLSMLHPDDRERITGVHQQAYATGEPYQMMERVVRPDGDVRYLSSNGQVIMDENGAPVRMRGTCVDITDRVLAEQERERTAARFKMLVESSPDAVLVLDAAGRVLQGNARAHEILGGDPVGHTIAEVLPEPARVGGEAVEATGLDGRPLRLDVAVANLNAPSESGLVATFLHDATPRLLAEENATRLLEANLRRRQALEINDNVVQGLTIAVFAMEDGDHQRASSYLSRTLAAGRKMMNDLLEPLGDGRLQPGGLVRSTPSSLDAPDATPTEAAP